jgi:hypothetical protein
MRVGPRIYNSEQELRGLTSSAVESRRSYIEFCNRVPLLYNRRGLAYRVL